MPNPPTVIAGIAWFRDDQWQLLRSLAADADSLEHTHGEWVTLAEKALQVLAQKGVSARKVNVDVNELDAWCKARNRPLDSSARADYAAEQLRNPGNRARQRPRGDQPPTEPR
jgi:hypothetical protein